jgi:hypothetical protein
MSRGGPSRAQQPSPDRFLVAVALMSGIVIIGVPVAGWALVDLMEAETAWPVALLVVGGSYLVAVGAHRTLALTGDGTAPVRQVRLHTGL